MPPSLSCRPRPTKPAPALPPGADLSAADQLPHEGVAFAHNSERQFAKLLDFYGIEWAYEPTTFALDVDGNGKPVHAFTPDFYLPAYDLYIEITTLSQKLVTKKNRKVRRLLEQHPGVQVKILYQRDYLHLLVKYGLEPPSQLAGYGHLGDRKLGQVPPDLDQSTLGLGPPPAGGHRTNRAG